MKYFLLLLVIAVLGMALYIDIESRHTIDRIASAYGCGRHDAMQTARSDPAEYDLPPCVELRKIWLWSERWPK